MKFAMVFMAAIWCALPAAGSAADPDSKPPASESPVHNSRDVDVRELLREVAVRMHKQIIWDPRTPQSMDLGSLQRQEITYPQLLALLQIHGFAVIADGNILEVIPDSMARQAALPVVASDNIKTLDDEWVTAILPVKGMSAVQLVTILRPLIPASGQINAMAERNAIIISGRTELVRQVIQATRMLEGLPATPP